MVNLFIGKQFVDVHEFMLGEGGFSSLCSLLIHNIIRIHNNVLWDYQYYVNIFPIFSLNVGLFYKLLSIPQNIVMDMNNVMQMFLGFFYFYFMYCGWGGGLTNRGCV